VHAPSHGRGDSCGDVPTLETLAAVSIMCRHLPELRIRGQRGRPDDDMTVLNELDRFHLVMDTVDRMPQTGDKGIYLKQQLKDKLIEHEQ
jgi:phosphoketolase